MRRAQLITSATAAKQLIRDKLGLVAPALLEARQAPFKSLTWLAAVEVVLGRDGGLPGVAALGYEESAALGIADAVGEPGRDSVSARPPGRCSPLLVMTAGSPGCAALRWAAPATRWVISGMPGRSWPAPRPR